MSINKANLKKKSVNASLFLCFVFVVCFIFLVWGDSSVHRFFWDVSLSVPVFKKVIPKISSC